MKVRDLINQVVREDMPDLERVRANCHRQAISQKPIVRKLRWSMATIVVAVLVFASAVYAATALFVRFDTGGSMAYTLVPYDSPELREQWENAFFMRTIYFNERAAILPSFAFSLSLSQAEGIDAETAQKMNEMLAGEIFTADGAPFTLIVAAPDDNIYRADDKGNTLYNSAGYEIGMITFPTTWDNEFVFYFKTVRTRTEVEQDWGFNDTYEDAMALLGRPFRLPAAHMDGFEPPRFLLESSLYDEPGAIRRVSIHYMAGDAIFEDLILSAENIRDESVKPFHLYMAGEIARFEVAGVTVHHVAASNVFWWIHDDFVYSLIPPFSFTDRQIREVIGSMIE